MVRGDGLRILVVDDDAATRVTLEAVVRNAGWSPVVLGDPELALEIMTGPDAPPIALIDWEMPVLSGVDLCRRVRAADLPARPYLIFVTGNSTPNDIVTGLDAGADGYMTKPIDARELQARVRAGLRTIALQHDLQMRLREAQAESVRTRPLRELLPICCCCRRIRDERQQWSTLEQYLAQKVDVQFTHGFCPTCLAQHVPPEERA